MTPICFGTRLTSPQGVDVCRLLNILKMYVAIVHVSNALKTGYEGALRNF